MIDVLHQLIDRVGYRSENEVRAAHEAVDEWFAEHFPTTPASSTVDSPAPGSASASASVSDSEHTE